MNITLYGPKQGSAMRVFWAMEELGQAYEHKNIDMRAGEHKGPEYLGINPVGQVPAASFDGLVMAESLAINRYACEKFNPALLGSTPEFRAKGMQWELFVMFNVQNNLSVLAGPKWGMPFNAEADAKARERLQKNLPVLDQYLSSAEYLAGGKFTIADINAGAAFEYAGFAEYDLTTYANISRWLTALRTRPSYLKVTTA